MKTVAHLNFRGAAREALQFYQSVFGGDLQLVTYQQAGQPDAPAPNDVIWGQVIADNGFAVMAFDVPPDQPWAPGTNAFYLSVRSATVEALKGHWDQLIVGGEVLQALAPSAWAPLYGMVKDRFGTTWLMDVAPTPR